MTQNVSGEVDRSIPVSTEDCDNVRNYSLHFGVAVTESLQKAMELFENDTTSYEKMIDFKRELCNWLATCGHESFQDSLWEHPTQAAADVLYELQFDKDVNEILSEKSDEQLIDLANRSMIESVKKHIDKEE
jgi:hypothetical protein